MSKSRGASAARRQKRNASLPRLFNNKPNRFHNPNTKFRIFYLKALERTKDEVRKNKQSNSET